MVKILIEKKYQINTNARFEIFSTSLVGGKYIAVENYTGDAPYLAKDAVVAGIPPLSMNSLMAMFSDAFASGSDEGMLAGVGGIVSSLHDTIATVKTVIVQNTNSITVTLSNVQQASIHLNSIVSNVDRKASSDPLLFTLFLTFPFASFILL